jgi:hypothetical protein
VERGAEILSGIFITERYTYPHDSVGILAENLWSNKELMMGPIPMKTTVMFMVNPYADEL